MTGRTKGGKGMGSGAELPTRSYLKLLGDRVRTIRSRRAMSRKALAKHSAVSERYLAALEAGKSNCSIVLLRRIAKAMGVPVAELIDERPERDVEQLLFYQLLERLSPAEMRQARELLLSRHDGLSSETRRARIALIGLRGGGKSTLGGLLGARLSIPFVELDHEIEKTSGMSLGEIFEMFGQPTFRRLERTALEATIERHARFVVATGGSLVTEPGTFERLLTSCLTIWVRAKPNEHMNRVIEQGDLRPMANNRGAMEDLVAILKSREPLYAKADLVLETTDKTAEQSVREILAWLEDTTSATIRRLARV
jgi:XRE family transcriptional regulator, aerobic/anaerobic benzoate catabolism transcriptional regulator